MTTEPNWLPIETMPDGLTAVTKIHDADGERNVQPLRKEGRLFFAGEMYVYYSPTHWRKP